MSIPPPFSRPLKVAIAALGVTQVIGWGTTYYLLSLLGGPIATSLNLSNGVMLAGVSITLLMTAFLGPRVGRFQDANGARVVMAGGSIMIAAGLATIGIAQDIWIYFLGWVLIGLGTPAALYNAAFTALTQISSVHGRRAITYLTFMGGLASTIFWPITAALLPVMEWREICLLYAALNIGICLPLHAFALGGKADLAAQNGAKSEAEPGLPEAQWPKAFFLLAGMLAINALIFNAWSLLVFPFLEGLGFAATAAVTVASAVGVFQVFGRMGEMAFGARYSAFMTALLSAILLPLAFTTLLASQGAVAVGMVFAALYGISNGMLTIARGALTLTIFGARGYGERLGKVTLPQGIFGALAPILGGFVITPLGSQGLLGVMLALAVLSLALMVMLMHHCRRHGLH